MTQKPTRRELEKVINMIIGRVKCDNCPLHRKKKNAYGNYIGECVVIGPRNCNVSILNYFLQQARKIG